MKIVLDIIIVILTVIAGAFIYLGRPTPGGVNNNVALLAPALFIGLIDALFILWRLLA